MITLNEPFNVDELLETIKEHLRVIQLLMMVIKTTLKDLLTSKNF